MKTTILVVDDQREIALVVESALKKVGYLVHHALSADRALEWLKDNTPDLFLLDIELPGVSGLKLLEIIRETDKTAGVPVIMLTVLSGESHKVKGLKTGADDYLVKPFSTPELLARVEALLRRSRNAGKMTNVIEIGPFRLDLDRMEMRVSGERLTLTAAEIELMSLFMHRKETVLTNQALAAALSKHGKEVTSGSVYTHIKNLRAKLGPHGKLIESVYATGYKLSV